ncbi:MAG: hypothetical protein CDV28_11117 [Candidatus Electronema aureum]|uniref:Uncharacterized protein n=1 Tax=Candidatus Electronema aureum TaxID=2005002 RepID=A0A521G2L4_9BACT|nr:MAG: hypothetical protein CDV28_11117 [Candidatus Electronema aureum]
MPIAEITAALAGVKHAFDIANLINNSEVSLDAAEVKLKLAELIDSLANAKIETAKFKDILLERDSEIQRLKKQIEKDDNMVYETPYYFLVQESGEKDGPYCQRCYDSNKKSIRLQSPNKNGYWKCNECSSDYKDSTYNEPVFTRINRSQGRSGWTL